MVVEYGDGDKIGNRMANSRIKYIFGEDIRHN